MSIEKNKPKEKIYEKEQILLGKKTESQNFVNNILDDNNPHENKCKICGNNNNLIQCLKCLNYICKDCIKQISHININKLKENEFICSNCQNNDILKKKRKESGSTCYICGIKYDDKNISNIDINSEEKNNIKNDFLNKGISLAEKEEDLINENNLNWSIKICSNCQNNELIGKILDKKKLPKKHIKNNIIDELSNIISKDKGETNIFNILDIKSENSSDNINESKEKEKEKEKQINEKEIIEINEQNEQNKKNIQINITNEDKNNINNINNINESCENPKLDLQNIIGSNLFIKDLNDNNANNKNLFTINKNDCINNNLNSLFNSNLVERNINTFLNINPNNQNPSTKNINPLLFNIKNNIPPNLIDMSNLNNNINTFHDINLLNNTKNQINNINNLKTINSTTNFQNNNNMKILNQNIPVEDKNNMISFIQNLNNNNTNLGNNIINYDINQNNLNNYTSNLNNINDGINKLIGLGETKNINNIQSNINDNNIKQDNLFQSNNNNSNNLNMNINSNLIGGVNNEIKATISKISEDLFSFDNNNIENNLNILNNIQSLTATFSKIFNEENKKKNNKQNNNENNKKELNNIKDKNLDNNNINKKENSQEDIKNNINDIQNDEKLKEIVNNMEVNEIINVSPSTRALIDYIIKVNQSLRNQIKTLKMYIEMQKVFVAIIYQNIEMFVQNISQNQFQQQIQKSILQNKDLNQNNQNNNIISQTPNNQNNNVIPQINPTSQISINTLNNLQNANPVSPPNSSSTLINTPNLNYNSPIIISPLSQLISNNNLGRSLSLFNCPSQQFKQDLLSNIPNIFNGRINFPLVPQQQGVNLLGNHIMNQNIPQMIPILNQMNVIGNNSINNSLQFVNNPKNNQISK